MVTLVGPYLLAFIALFVAVDSLGNIPIFITLIEGSTKKERKRVIMDSVTTATVVALVFMFVGKVVLRLIGITISDFQVAGGALLFIISAKLLLPSGGKDFLSDSHGKDLGVFPLGTPLITGPAVLTTSLIMVDSYGLVPTFVAVLLNMLIVWITLAKADVLLKLFGQNGLRGLAKIMYILLAAIGVMMVRKGILAIISGRFLER
ncbi:MAG: MarC family protein [Candidatus Omnitrophota bacterium]